MWSSWKFWILYFMISKLLLKNRVSYSFLAYRVHRRVTCAKSSKHYIHDFTLLQTDATKKSENGLVYFICSSLYERSYWPQYWNMCTDDHIRKKNSLVMLSVNNYIFSFHIWRMIGSGRLNRPYFFPRLTISHCFVVEDHGRSGVEFTTIIFF